MDRNHNSTIQKTKSVDNKAIIHRQEIWRLNWQLWLGILISVVCLYLAFRDVRLAELIKELRSIKPAWLLLSLLISIITILAKGYRWRIFFDPTIAPSFQRAFSIQSIGMLFNLFMPARLGDLARVYLMGEAERINKTYILGTIVVEKLLDLSFLLLSVTLLLTQFAIPNWFLKSSEAVAMVVGIIIALIILILWKRNLFLGFVEKISVFAPQAWRHWLIRQVRGGFDSLNVLNSPAQLNRLFLWSFLIWILGFLTNYVLFIAMHLTLSIWAAVFLLAVLQAGIAVPSSPGRIGVFHYLTVLSLGFFRVESQVGLGYGLVLYVVAIAPPTLCGAWYLWRSEFAWKGIREAARRLRSLRSSIE